MTARQPLPLKGIRVVDYTHFLAGPYLSRCLAALGADVVKVERPIHGDSAREHPHVVQGYSGYFMQQNLGKRGLCVDLKDPRGLALVHRLVDRADVFVENYRPGALDRLGLGYDALAQRNPKLVYCSISAYGHTGPHSSRPGFGLIAEAMGGAMSFLGAPGETPPLFRVALADMYTGIHGVAAVLAVLIGRGTTGRGQHVDMALYDCMVALHEYAVQCYTLSDGTVRLTQSGSDLPESTVYGVFPGSDGYLVIAAQQDQSWRALARLVGGDELAGDARLHSLDGRNAHRAQVRELIEAWTRPRSVADSLALLDGAGVACAKVQTIAEVVDDPQLAARGVIAEHEYPVLGRIRLPSVPMRFSELDLASAGPAPDLGEHNRQVAEELGYTAGQIDTLIAEGVLYHATPAGRPAGETAGAPETP